MPLERVGGRIDVDHHPGGAVVVPALVRPEGLTDGLWPLGEELPPL